MKSWLLAAAALVALATPAAAQTWTDPTNSFSIANPEKWPVEAQKAQGDAAFYIVGAADAECWLVHLNRPDSAAMSPSSVKKSYAAPFTTDQWAMTGAGLRIFSPTQAVSNATTETVNNWPVQLATLSGKDGPIQAALHARPGFEVRTFCLSYDGKDRSALFGQMIRSVASPKDAEWAAAEATAAAEREAAAAKPAEPAPEEAKKKKRGS